MKLWPHDAFEIYTAGPMAETMERLRSRVEVNTWLRWFWPLGKHEPFAGEVGEASFRFRRIILYHNDFRPMIVGSVRPEGSGSVVSIELRLPHPIAALVAVWLSMAGAFLVVSLGAFDGDGQSPLAFLIPGGMLLFGYCLVTAAFWPEAFIKAKRLLRDLLADEAATVSEPGSADRE